MNYDPATKKVTPDSSMGRLRVYKEESATVFCWTNLSTNKDDDEVYAFPMQATFQKVKKSSSRVYILKYLDSDRHFFYWMQEPDASKDDNICKLIKDTILQESEDEVMADINTQAQPVPVQTLPAQIMPNQPIPGQSLFNQSFPFNQGFPLNQAAMDAQTLSRYIEMITGRSSHAEKSNLKI